VLSGTKTFTLVSPIDGVWFERASTYVVELTLEPFHPQATLVRTEAGLEPQLDEPPAHPVPWVADLAPPLRARAITVHVDEGQTLFLPSGWWHKVEQDEGDGMLAAAVN
jgi:jumonji domain-containing protein 7